MVLQRKDTSTSTCSSSSSSFFSSQPRPFWKHSFLVLIFESDFSSFSSDMWTGLQSLQEKASSSQGVDPMDTSLSPQSDGEASEERNEEEEKGSEKEEERNEDEERDEAKKSDEETEEEDDHDDS
ncbi:uncharacterized protein LOC131151423 [Malania oleifera]|uniref:uncharacterized protein LOC131151423 n=1 Tax=Malania oleifera TaxID=397392 RepID=UPI0025AE783D|nr:uncharacterized protein LOC131151423 [Malania oleifera]